MVGKHGSPLERLHRHSIPEPNSGCWLWLGSLGKFGYGQIMMPSGKPSRAHRISYQVYKGKIPKGLEVRHTCDIRCCINPDHLLVGTRKQNMEDAQLRGRIARRFKLPQTKLDDNTVQLIIKDVRSQRVIASDYAITQSHVSRLKNRKTSRTRNS